MRDWGKPWGGFNNMDEPVDDVEAITFGQSRIIITSFPFLMKFPNTNQLIACRPSKTGQGTIFPEYGQKPMAVRTCKRCLTWPVHIYSQDFRSFWDSYSYIIQIIHIHFNHSPKYCQYNTIVDSVKHHSQVYIKVELNDKFDVEFLCQIPVRDFLSSGTAIQLCINRCKTLTDDLQTEMKERCLKGCKGELRESLKKEQKRKERLINGMKRRFKRMASAVHWKNKCSNKPGLTWIVNSWG